MEDAVRVVASKKKGFLLLSILTGTVQNIDDVLIESIVGVFLSLFIKSYEI